MDLGVMRRQLMEIESYLGDGYVTGAYWDGKVMRVFARLATVEGRPWVLTMDNEDDYSLDATSLVREFADGAKRWFASIIKEALVPLKEKLEREAFQRDRYGHNNPYPAPYKPHFSRIIYMCHAKGHVMARRPGCPPFVIPEKLWLSFDYYSKD